MNKRSESVQTCCLPQHPGEFLFRKCLVPFRISGRQLADHIGIAPQRLNGICEKRTCVTPDLAWLLGYTFGTTPAEWLRMQMAYDLTKYKLDNPEPSGVSLIEDWIPSDITEPAEDSWRAAVSCRLRRTSEALLPFGLPRTPVTPGEILTEVFLNPSGEQPRPFARKLGLHHSRIQRVIKGTRKVKPNMAWLLAEAFGTTPHLWMNLQGIYDLVAVYPEIEPVAMLEKAFFHNADGCNSDDLEGIPETVELAESTERL